LNVSDIMQYDWFTKTTKSLLLLCNL